MNKLTIKQEKFALKYVELGNASEAYRQSYSAKNMQDTTIWTEACLLLGDQKVAKRVESIRNELAESNAVTLESISLELDGAISLAKDLEQASPMVTGIMGKAKLHGLVTDKKELTGKNGKDLLNTVEITFVGVDDE